MTNAAPKFRLHIATVKPGNFGPIGLLVHSEAGFFDSVVIEHGAVVEPVSPVVIDGEGVSFRTVRCEDGRTGRVCWQEFDGRSGFEPIG